MIPFDKPHFSFLRMDEWEPRFAWVKTTAEAADLINRPHEDYPQRVTITETTLKSVRPKWSDPAMPHDVLMSPRSRDLLRIHGRIFADKDFGGQWRRIGVRVGPHIAPASDRLRKLILDLARAYPDIHTIDQLKAFYFDLETIHPFQDGNGRVGGVVIGAWSHMLKPENGWLAPLQ